MIKIDMINNPKLVHYLLRLSIASVFLYAAISATIQPFNWIGYIPQVFYTIASPQILLIGFSLFQFILAIWILTGWRSFYSGVFAGLTLLAIIIANWGDINVLFRDFAIFFAAIALAVGSYQKKSN